MTLLKKILKEKVEYLVKDSLKNILFDGWGGAVLIKLKDGSIQEICKNEFGDYYEANFKDFDAYCKKYGEMEIEWLDELSDVHDGRLKIIYEKIKKEYGIVGMYFMEE